MAFLIFIVFLEIKIFRKTIVAYFGDFFVEVAFSLIKIHLIKILIFDKQKFHF